MSGGESTRRNPASGGQATISRGSKEMENPSPNSNMAQQCRAGMLDDIAASVIALGAKTREATNTSTEFP